MGQAIQAGQCPHGQKSDFLSIQFPEIYDKKSARNTYFAAFDAGGGRGLIE